MFASNSFDFYRERVFFFAVNVCSSRHVSLGKIIWFYNNIFRKHNRCCCCNWNYGWCVKYILFLEEYLLCFTQQVSQLEEKGKTGILFDHFFSGMCECTNTRCFFLLNMLGYCFCLARVTYEFIQQIKIQLTRVQRFVNTWYFAIRSCVCWVSECVCVYLCLLCQNL